MKNLRDDCQKLVKKQLELTAPYRKLVEHPENIQDLAASVQEKLRCGFRALDSVKNRSWTLNESFSRDPEVDLPIGRYLVADSAQLAALRQHEFFLLKLYLKHGRGLPAMDSGGTSDPFIKMKLAGKMVCKSKIIYKSLNPLWDETFEIPVEDPFQPLQMKVFDHDWGMNDDFIGEAILEISSLELEKEKEFTFDLSDPNKPNASLGSITVTAVLSPRSKEEHFQSVSGSKSSDFKKQKNQQWDSVVNVVLVEAKDLMAMDSEGTSDPYVKCRLGSEKYRSKVISRTLSPRWLEQFDMHFYESGPQIFEMEVFDHDARSKDDFMGKASVNVANLEKEKTHDIWTELEDGAGTIHVLITVSGVTSVDTSSDLLVYKEDVDQLNEITRRYSLKESFKQVKDIGYLTVRVFKAHGLTSADIGGKSDPFCVLELVNARLQTQTEYKTLSPQWNKIFFFNVKDIHSVLEVTIYDEDKDHKMEFLGKVCIPLLKVRCGERRWYALKDKKLLGRAKGNSPQVLLEMDIVWNTIRASIRTFNPREEKYTQEQVKFKRAVFLRNVNRLKVMGASMAEGAAFAKSILDWESKPRTIIAFIVFMVAVYTFELHMAPVGILLALLKGWLVNLVTAGYRQSDDDDYVADDEDDDEEREKLEELLKDFPLLLVLMILQDEKKSLKEKLMAVQEVTAMVQNIMGYIASLGECVQNTFNFTIPFLSWLLIFVMSIVTLVLYLIPIRYLIMLWGCHKFSKKLLRPNAIPNNELLDFLSRVPDNDQLRQYRELRPTKISDSDRRREQRQKSQQQKKAA